MHYYKETDEHGRVFQYEATNRIINSYMVMEITKEEYYAFIVSLQNDEAESNQVGDDYASTVH